MFSVGDMAVYPAHGVGVIEAIEIKTIGEIDQSFYVMRIIDKDMTVMIPTTNSKNLGLRAIISKVEVKRIMALLAEPIVKVGGQTWNRRYRDYMEKINTGSLFEVAEVLKDLLLVSDEKGLSYGERKMLETAKNLLVTEIALAGEWREAEVERRLTELFGESGRHLTSVS